MPFSKKRAGKCIPPVGVGKPQENEGSAQHNVKGLQTPGGRGEAATGCVNKVLCGRGRHGRESMTCCGPVFPSVEHNENALYQLFTV